MSVASAKNTEHANVLGAVSQDGKREAVDPLETDASLTTLSETHVDADLREQTQFLIAQNSGPEVAQQIEKLMVGVVDSGSASELYQIAHDWALHSAISKDAYGGIVARVIDRLSERLEARELTTQEYRDKCTALANAWTSFTITSLPDLHKASLLIGLACPMKGAVISDENRRLARAIDAELPINAEYLSTDMPQRENLAGLLKNDIDLARLSADAARNPNGETLFAVGKRVAALVDCAYNLGPTEITEETDTSNSGSSKNNATIISIRRDDEFWAKRIGSVDDKIREVAHIAIHEMRHQIQDSLAAGFITLRTLLAQTSPVLEQGRLFLLGKLAYETEKGYFHYRNSSLERDADNFAQSILALAGVRL